ncbi:Gfo/Idh/MocA family oxidoreductase [Rhizomonospora bruguierae]|uniref:Gfo/Idh/MocA family oxidoreductase n=1 Tax=Rhizomonospora bruguierae TaxID=1581705 RepID=UPI001BCF4E2F|nr:Gfo/Idh/MocA family oxidoreductase [Micromonospora sp. NBRC 107566]
MTTLVLEVAVVGAGGTAAAHARGVAATRGVLRIVAAVDPVPSRLRAFGERWAVPNLYYDLPTLLEAECSDLVALCSPPALHREQAVACIARGRAVLSHHPTALSLADLDAIAAATGPGRGAGGVFAGAFPERFAPADDPRTGLAAQLTAVHAALLAGEPPPVTLADTRSTVERLAGIRSGSRG